MVDTIGAGPGLPEHLKLAGAKTPSIFYVDGSPDGDVVGNAGSDIAINGANGNMYICKSGTTLTTWYNIGSTT